MAEADAQPAEPPVRGRLLLPETVEHEREEFRVDAVPLVLHGDLQPPPEVRRPVTWTVPPEGENLTPFARRFQRTCLRARGVALHGRQVRIERAADDDAPAPRARAHGVESRREDLGNRDRSPAELQPEIVDPRQVDQVRQHARQRVGLPEDRLERAPRVRVVAVRVEQDLGPAHDPGQRRADLVGKVREEVVLQPVAPLELLDEARVA